MLVPNGPVDWPKAYGPHGLPQARARGAAGVLDTVDAGSVRATDAARPCVLAVETETVPANGFGKAGELAASHNAVWGYPAQLATRTAEGTYRPAHPQPAGAPSVAHTQQAAIVQYQMQMQEHQQQVQYQMQMQEHQQQVLHQWQQHQQMLQGGSCAGGATTAKAQVSMMGAVATATLSSVHMQAFHGSSAKCGPRDHAHTYQPQTGQAVPTASTARGWSAPSEPVQPQALDLAAVFNGLASRKQRQREEHQQCPQGTQRREVDICPSSEAQPQTAIEPGWQQLEQRPSLQASGSSHAHCFARSEPGGMSYAGRPASAMQWQAAGQEQVQASRTLQPGVQPSFPGDCQVLAGARGPPMAPATLASHLSAGPMPGQQTFASLLDSNPGYCATQQWPTPAPPGTTLHQPQHTQHGYAAAQPQQHQQQHPRAVGVASQPQRLQAGPEQGRQPASGPAPKVQYHSVQLPHEQKTQSQPPLSSHLQQAPSEQYRSAPHHSSGCQERPPGLPHASQPSLPAALGSHVTSGCSAPVAHQPSHEDVMVVVGKHTFRASRSLLAGCSRYFSLLFAKHTGSFVQEASMNHINSTAFGRLLRYINTGNPQFLDGMLCEIAEVAHQLLLEAEWRLVLARLVESATPDNIHAHLTWASRTQAGKEILPKLQELYRQYAAGQRDSRDPLPSAAAAGTGPSPNGAGSTGNAASCAARNGINERSAHVHSSHLAAPAASAGAVVGALNACQYSQPTGAQPTGAAGQQQSQRHPPSRGQHPFNAGMGAGGSRLGFSCFEEQHRRQQESLLQQHQLSGQGSSLAAANDAVADEAEVAKAPYAACPHPGSSKAHWSAQQLSRATVTNQAGGVLSQTCSGGRPPPEQLLQQPLLPLFKHEPRDRTGSQQMQRQGLPGSSMPSQTVLPRQAAGMHSLPFAMHPDPPQSSDLPCSVRLPSPVPLRLGLAEPGDADAGSASYTPQQAAAGGGNVYGLPQVTLGELVPRLSGEGHQHHLPTAHFSATAQPSHGSVPPQGQLPARGNFNMSSPPGFPGAQHCQQRQHREHHQQGPPPRPSSAESKNAPTGAEGMRASSGAPRLLIENQLQAELQHLLALDTARREQLRQQQQRQLLHPQEAQQQQQQQRPAMSPAMQPGGYDGAGESGPPAQQGGGASYHNLAARSTNSGYSAVLHAAGTAGAAGNAAHLSRAQGPSISLPAPACAPASESNGSSNGAAMADGIGKDQHGAWSGGRTGTRCDTGLPPHPPGKRQRVMHMSSGMVQEEALASSVAAVKSVEDMVAPMRWPPPVFAPAAAAANEDGGGLAAPLLLGGAGEYDSGAETGSDSVAASGCMPHPPAGMSTHPRAPRQPHSGSSGAVVSAGRWSPPSEVGPAEEDEGSARTRIVNRLKIGQHQRKPLPPIHLIRPGCHIAQAQAQLPPSSGAVAPFGAGQPASVDDVAAAAAVDGGRRRVKDRQVLAMLLPVQGQAIGASSGGVRLKRGTAGRGEGAGQNGATTQAGKLLNALREAKALMPSRFVVRRSGIAQNGVFVAAPIPKNTLLMEYFGEAVRSTVADLREKRYNKAGLGCYLFNPGGPPDEAVVLDATFRGNIMRYVNHSCGPNCTSRTTVIDGQRRIFLFSLVDLQPGMELTYDYKLSSLLCMDLFKGLPEEVMHNAAAQTGTELIKCQCGSRKCRKYL